MICSRDIRRMSVVTTKLQPSSDVEVKTESQNLQDKFYKSSKSIQFEVVDW